jgi:hypothetical protein
VIASVDRVAQITAEHEAAMSSLTAAQRLAIRRVAEANTMARFPEATARRRLAAILAEAAEEPIEAA